MRAFNPSLRVDQESEFAASVHGKRVLLGDRKAATCVSCHGYHGVRPVNDPAAPVHPARVASTCGRCHSDAQYMQSYGIPTDQVNKYETSVHADALLKRHDLSAPTCNDCHGNHGAAPPGATSVANVCGTCHVRQSELFLTSPHRPAFEAMSLSACVACHNNHDVARPTDAWIGTSAEATCVNCHSQGEPAYDTATAMHQLLTGLAGDITNAEQVLQRATRAGMDVSKARFELSEGHGALTNARVLVHSFSRAALEESTAKGVLIARKARQAAQMALEELQFRRKGLAVSLLIIVVAIFSVYKKIRQIEQRP
jgi:hypothetical protein